MNNKPLKLVLIFIVPLVLIACKNEAQNISAPPPPVEVDVAIPLKHSITEWDEYTGRFKAVERVDIRARVTGYLTDISFRDGQVVSKGDVLFTIDPRPFEYQLQQVQAQYNLALREHRRAQSLRNTRAISQEELERRLQVYKAAEAQLNLAKLDVEFTQVRAPIDGRISDSFVDVGNLVTENQTLLSRVVSVDPIHFEFEASQSQLLKYIRLDRAGKRPGSDENPNPVFIKLQDEKTFAHPGRMDFVDNIVDTGTGTILGRALVSNGDRVIYPGLFGRARLIGSGAYDAVLIPENAVQTDQSRKFVYVVNNQSLIDRAYVELGPILDNGYIPVRSGLNGTERIVVSGVQRIRASNQPVTPKIIELEWKEVDTMPDVNSVPTIQQMNDKSSKTSDPVEAENSIEAEKK